VYIFSASTNGNLSYLISEALSQSINNLQWLHSCIRSARVPAKGRTGSTDWTKYVISEGICSGNEASSCGHGLSARRNWMLCWPGHPCSSTILLLARFW